MLTLARVKGLNFSKRLLPALLDDAKSNSAANPALFECAAICAGPGELVELVAAQPHACSAFVQALATHPPSAQRRPFSRAALAALACHRPHLLVPPSLDLLV